MSDPGRSTVKMPMPDQIIAGRYRIISRLGSGGMGMVFLAEQLGVGNKVALKFLDPEPTTDETRATRFLREAKVALEVQHPGATQILDLGRDEAMRLFMCFELVEGEDLREVIKREGRLRFGEAKSICIQVAQVLAFAHERGIVHRDVKPENLRVRRDLGGTHVKVLDFGIARLLKDTGVRLTAEGMLAGTPRYMAPEQVKDEPIDGRIDQYALGLVLFEMLTGAVAIGGKNITQILMHQLKTLVAPLAWVDPQLANPAIDAFIAKACAKDPLDRFASMADFVVGLQALQVDERSWPEPKSPPANPGSSTAQTRDGAPVLAPKEGESDTLVRVPVQTQQERRLEVPTEPDREPVARRASSERKTDPEQVRQSAKVAHPALELPTDPDRPMVSREKLTLPSRREASRQKVVGLVVPQRPRRWWGWVLTLALVGLGAAAVWWWLRLR
ncbi:MAG: protein kinase [Archangium sp.]|nr:protein kinase [Archangium sp.]MDP3152216.1 protein kinase [Archangium sp.]MDP3571061.1 protein kinase [Archangium sp.]